VRAPAPPKLSRSPRSVTELVAASTSIGYVIGPEGLSKRPEKRLVCTTEAKVRAFGRLVRHGRLRRGAAGPLSVLRCSVEDFLSEAGCPGLERSEGPVFRTLGHRFAMAQAPVSQVFYIAVLRRLPRTACSLRRLGILRVLRFLLNQLDAVATLALAIHGHGHL
jgi:hypothetical protein